MTAEIPSIPRLGVTPYEHAPNPFASTALATTLEWAHASGLDRVYSEEALMKRVTLSAMLGSLVCPDLSATELETVVKQIAWLYAFDDLADSKGKTSQDFSDMLAGVRSSVNGNFEGHQDSSNPFVKSLGSLALGIRQTASSGQFERWQNAISGYLGGVEQEVQFKNSRITPSLNTFMSMRHHTSGVPVVLSLIEPTTGIALPEAEWQNPASTLNELIIECTKVVAIDNDFVSLRKEIEEGAAELNLLTVIQHERKCTLQEAMDIALGMRDEAEQRILDIRNKLIWEKPGVLSSPSLSYIRAVQDWVHGHLQLASQASRYSQQAPKSN